MIYLFSVLLLISCIGLIAGLISPDKVLASEKVKTKKRVAQIYVPMIIVFLILVGITFPSDSSDNKKESQPAVSNSTQQTKTDTPCTIGSDITAFKAKFPEAPVPKEWLMKNIYSNKYLMNFTDNGGSPSKVQSIDMSLQKRQSDWHITSHEVLPLKKIDDVNQIISSLIPSDSKLIREKTFQDTTYKAPLERYKIFREYESTWLSENFTPSPYIDVKNKRLFTVIIRKIDKGYLEITITADPLSWEEIDEGSFPDSGWKEVK